MYAPLAFELIRVEQEQIRRRTESALRNPESTATISDVSAGRNRTFRRFHRRPATAC